MGASGLGLLLFHDPYWRILAIVGPGHFARTLLPSSAGLTAAEMLAKIGDGEDGAVGTAVDTGWWGTHGYDAAQAIRELGLFQRNSDPQMAQIFTNS